MRGRLLHGYLIPFSSYSKKPIIIDHNGSKYTLYIGRHWTEVHVVYTVELNQWRPVYGEDTVLCVIETNNPKVAVLASENLLITSHGDDCVYAVFRGGRLHKFIRLWFPAWFLDHYNVRNPKHFKKLAVNASVDLYVRNDEDYFDEALDFREALFGELGWYNYDIVPKIREFIDFAKFVGDDILMYTIRYIIREFIEEHEFDEELVRVAKTLI